MVTFSSAMIAKWLALWIWPFIRILSMLTSAPIFDNRSVPRRVRIGLAALVAMLVSPLIPQPPSLDNTQAIVVIAQQILVGVGLGFTLRLVFAAVEMAGDLLGLQMGLAFAQFIDPQRSTPSPLIGSYLVVLVSLAFLAINGHLLIIASIVKSFEIVPIGVTFDFLDAKRIVTIGSLLFSIGLQIGLPVVAALLTANVVLGILAKAAPSMNITSIGFAVTLLTGFWILWLGLPYLATLFEDIIMRILQVPIFTQPASK
jgi:flagellar biosynthetic protein FliR